MHNTCKDYYYASNTCKDYYYASNTCKDYYYACTGSITMCILFSGCMFETVYYNVSATEYLLRLVVFLISSNRKTDYLLIKASSIPNKYTSLRTFQTVSNGRSLCNYFAYASSIPNKCTSLSLNFSE